MHDKDIIAAFIEVKEDGITDESGMGGVFIDGEEVHNALFIAGGGPIAFKRVIGIMTGGINMRNTILEVLFTDGGIFDNEDAGVSEVISMMIIIGEEDITIKIINDFIKRDEGFFDDGVGIEPHDIIVEVRVKEIEGEENFAPIVIKITFIDKFVIITPFIGIFREVDIMKFNIIKIRTVIIGEDEEFIFFERGGG